MVTLDFSTLHIGVRLEARLISVFVCFFLIASRFDFAWFDFMLTFILMFIKDGLV